MIQASQPTTDSNGAGMKTILVAEDNDSNYLLLSNILRRSYNLVRAVNGEEAVKLCLGGPRPDLILMDIKMPIMDGLEATRKIRETDKEVYIIALTAHAFEEDRKKALEAGCNGFMTKPIDVMGLRSTLKDIIGV